MEFFIDSWIVFVCVIRLVYANYVSRVCNRIRGLLSVFRFKLLRSVLAGWASPANWVGLLQLFDKAH